MHLFKDKLGGIAGPELPAVMCRVDVSSFIGEGVQVRETRDSSATIPESRKHFRLPTQMSSVSP